MSNKNYAIDEQDAAARRLEQARTRARALIEQQGVAPIVNIDELRGDFWPEAESTDDFLAWLRVTRQEGTQSRSSIE